MLISQGKLAVKDTTTKEAYITSSKKSWSRSFKCGRRGHVAWDCKSKDKKPRKDKKDRVDGSSNSDTSETSTMERPYCDGSRGVAECCFLVLTQVSTCMLSHRACECERGMTKLLNS